MKIEVPLIFLLATCLPSLTSSNPLPSKKKAPNNQTSPESTRHHFSIRFDYRFDDGFFSEHPDRQRTLEAAAKVWSNLIVSDFPEVSPELEPMLLLSDDGHNYRGEVSTTISGKTCQKWTEQSPHKHTRTPEKYPGLGLGDHNYCRNPDQTPYVWCYTTDPDVRYEACETDALKTLAPETQEPIDDLVVFVYGLPMAGTTKAWAKPLNSPAAGKAGEVLSKRLKKVPYQPWAGVLVVDSEPNRPWFFDQSPETFNDIPSATHYDFYTTAMHEIGHILGFTTSVPFKKYTQDNAFAGPKAMAANNNQPVPLESDEGHLAQPFSGDLLRPTLENLLMSGSASIQGYRIFPNRTELAMLEDLGYEFSEEAMSRYHPLDWRGFSLYRDQKEETRSPSSRWIFSEKEPKGLWFFDDPERLYGAIRGTPVLYQPKTTGLLQETATKDAIQLKDGSLLWAEHPLTEGNCGGEELNCYSFVFDVRLPELGKDVPLLNTNGGNQNEAEAWINAAGSVGVSKVWSKEKLKPKQWYRVIVTVDIPKQQMIFYANGKKLLAGKIGGIDKRFSLSVNPPRFVLFGSKIVEAGALLDVKRVGWYDWALGAEEVKQLGSVE